MSYLVGNPKIGFLASHLNYQSFSFTEEPDCSLSVEDHKSGGPSEYSEFRVTREVLCTLSCQYDADCMGASVEQDMGPEYARLKCRLYNDYPALQDSMTSVHYSKYCPGMFRLYGCSCHVM